MTTLSQHAEAVSVHDAPAVAEAQRAASTARADYSAACAEEKRLNGILSPYVERPHTGTPLETIQAELALPKVREHRLLTESVLIDTTKRLEQARRTAQGELEATRLRARKSLIRDVAKLLEPALQAAARLNEFDLESERLGCNRPDVPFPGLIGDLGGGVRWQLDRLKRHGLL